jgi:polysaccharide pyruvyl transferase WcaK-like protein
MKVLLIHAYSRFNSGDGLLVDLTGALAREAVGDDIELTVLASEASSFRPDEDVLQWASRVSLPSTTLDLLSAGLLGPSKEIERAVDGADLVLAVGGGYLRGRTFVAALKSLLVHVRQSRYVTGRTTAPVVYLPQSIGPLPWWSRGLTEASLSRAAAVCVRDDVSYDGLRGRAPVQRFPDLAVLELAQGFRRPPSPQGGAKSVVFVPRRLSSPGGYGRLLDHVLREHDEWEWAAQSTARGNDDRAFISEVAHRPARTLKEVLSQPGEVELVVSTRLHGAVEALLAGVPSVHLSYERKGLAAFEDLGLGPFVTSARRATPGWLDDRVEALRSDPEAYWAMFEQARRRLMERRRALVELVREVAQESSSAPSTRTAEPAAALNSGTKP